LYFSLSLPTDLKSPLKTIIPARAESTMLISSVRRVNTIASTNSTLNFSILDKDNANVNNVYAGLTIREKNTAKVVGQIPYKFYEFSDITFPYKFANNTGYIATFEARINGDPKYQDNPHYSNREGHQNHSPISARFTNYTLYLCHLAAIEGGII
jgi:hypothetical protein